MLPEMKPIFSELRGAMVWLMAVMAGLVSGMSLIKSVVTLIGLGLTKYASALIEYYRQLARPIYDLLNMLLPFSIVMNELLTDFLLLYCVGFGITLRPFSFGNVLPAFIENDSGKVTRVEIHCVNRFSWKVFIPYNIMYLARSIERYRAVLMMNNSRLYAPGSSPHPIFKATATQIRQTWLSLALIPVALIVFFSINSGS